MSHGFERMGPMDSSLGTEPYNTTHLSGRQEGTRPVSGAPPHDRQAIHAYVSKEAHTAWGIFSEVNGVSLTSLLEALGLELRGELEDIDAADLRQDWIKSARRIDAERRRRGGVSQR
jgi:hypothetical protein